MEVNLSTIYLALKWQVDNRVPDTVAAKRFGVHRNTFRNWRIKYDLKKLAKHAAKKGPEPVNTEVRILQEKQFVILQSDQAIEAVGQKGLSALNAWLNQIEDKLKSDDKNCDIKEMELVIKAVATLTPYMCAPKAAIEAAKKDDNESLKDKYIQYRQLVSAAKNKLKGKSNDTESEASIDTVEGDSEE